MSEPHWILLVDGGDGMPEVVVDGPLFVDEKQAIEAARRAEVYHRKPARLYRCEPVNLAPESVAPTSMRLPDPWLAFTCPYCGAVPGAPCESMARAGRPTKRPHPERMRRASAPRGPQETP